MTTRKTITLTRWNFVGKEMSLLLNTLSRLVTAFLPSSKRLVISWLQLPIAVIFGAQTNKVCHCFHCFSIYLPWCDETGCHHISFLNVKPKFSLSSLILIKRLFSSSLYAIRVVSSVYLSLLIFLPAILIPACALSNLAFHMMYTAYKLNKQGDNIQHWHTPFGALLGTSLFFHVQFYLLLLDLHTGFSEGR